LRLVTVIHTLQTVNMSGIRRGTLQPTLWRTCRVLASSRRLRMLGLFVDSGEQNVAEVALALQIPRPVASQYLRALNARGLLQVRRQGRWVYYRIGADERVPFAPRLLEALQRSIRCSGDPVQPAYRVVTGFTHPRRVEIVRCLAGRVLSQRELAARAGISQGALSRHLRKLCARGILDKDKRGYRWGYPAEPLARVLMELAAAV
jgi:DNA-binding transcriptional ArsR family regulator